MHMMDELDQDKLFMTYALQQALLAQQKGEVPVGAVLVQNGCVVATGYNQPIGLNDPTAHAEILALRTAAQLIGNYRLPGCVLYVTLEPCAMCAMAMLHARLDRVVYATSDPKTGAAGSVLNLFEDLRLNHHTHLTSGVMAHEGAQILKQFFVRRRLERAQEKDKRLSHE